MELALAALAVDSPGRAVYTPKPYSNYLIIDPFIRWFLEDFVGFHRSNSRIDADSFIFIFMTVYTNACLSSP